jgi:hypothetical protein
MKIIQDYSNHTLSLNSKIHPLGVVFNINQLGFVNLTSRWSHRSTVWIPYFYLFLPFFLQNPLPPKSNHSWNLWYPLEWGCKSKISCCQKPEKTTYMTHFKSPIYHHKTKKKNCEKKNNNYKTYYQFCQTHYNVCIQFETSPSLQHLYWI